MDLEQAKRHIKEDLENYLSGRGINPGKNFICLNPDHPEKNPSMSFDRQRYRVHCFSCGASYDTFDLIGIEFGLDKKEAFKKAIELYGYGKTSGALPPNPNQRDISLWKPVVRHTPLARAENGIVKGDNLPLPGYGAEPHKTPKDTFNYKEYFQKTQAALQDTDYLQKRGISLETAKRCSIGYDPVFYTNTGSWQALIIPTGEFSFLARNTDNNADKANRIRKRGAGGPYRLQEALQSSKPIFIVEGEIDALSVLEGGYEACALGSVANVGKVLSFFEGQGRGGAASTPPPKGHIPLETHSEINVKDHSHNGIAKGDYPPMPGYGAEPHIIPPLLIALDNDPEGEKAAQKLLEGLAALEIPAYRVQIAEGYKDPNEALVADREGFLAALRAAEEAPLEQERREREQYLATSAAHHIHDFLDGIAKSVDTPAISTGFGALDDALDGGLYEGLYIFGAISSLGKTTFMVQVADQIAKAGQDVLFFSLEMSRTELIAKSISRLTVERCLERGKYTTLAKTTRGITVGERYTQYNQEENELINECVQEYKRYAHRMFISEGIGEIGVSGVRETVKKHIAVMGNAPVVMIDYLQILAPYNERMTDKQNTDRAVLELKRISRDYKIPVIGISSFNRQNYREAVTMEAFKESGAIEYSSDVLIGLQLKGAGEKEFDVNEEKKKNPRDVELKILKNRNGRTGISVGYGYYPLFNYFREE